MTPEEQRKMDLLRMERDELKSKVERLERLDAAELEGYIKNYEKLNEGLLGTIFNLEIYLKDFRIASLRGMQRKDPMALKHINHYANLILSYEHVGRDADPQPLTDDEEKQVLEFENWVMSLKGDIK